LKDEPLGSSFFFYSHDMRIFDLKDISLSSSFSQRGIMKDKHIFALLKIDAQWVEASDTPHANESDDK